MADDVPVTDTVITFWRNSRRCTNQAVAELSIMSSRVLCKTIRGDSSCAADRIERGGTIFCVTVLTMG